MTWLYEYAVQIPDNDKVLYAFVVTAVVFATVVSLQAHNPAAASRVTLGLVLALCIVYFVNESSVQSTSNENMETYAQMLAVLDAVASANRQRNKQRQVTHNLEMPKYLYTDADIIRLVYWSLDILQAAPPVFVQIMYCIDSVLELHETNTDKSQSSELVDMISDQRDLALNHWNSLEFSVPSNPVVHAKVVAGRDRLRLLLQRHIDDIVHSTATGGSSRRRRIQPQHMFLNVPKPDDTGISAESSESGLVPTMGYNPRFNVF